MPSFSDEPFDLPLAKRQKLAESHQDTITSVGRVGRNNNVNKLRPSPTPLFASKIFHPFRVR